MSTLKLASPGIFKTIQGEGAQIGMPMIFIRLAGCSVGCSECDTDYRVAEKLEVGEIIQRVENLAKGPEWIWLTGGEPTDQNLDELIFWLKKFGHRVAIATSGVRKIRADMFDWISVSPHSTDFKQDYGHEIKIIPGLNGLNLEEINTMNLGMFAYKFIQPLNNVVLAECVDFVLKNPGWRLSIQAHKYWGLP